MLTALLLSALISPPQDPPYKNSALPVDQRVQDLLKRMTVEEKLNQLRADGNPAAYEKALTTTGFGFFTVANIRGEQPAQLAASLNALQKEGQHNRLGIPIIPYEESLHGLINPGHVSFPQAIGLAATWDPEFIHRCAQVIAQEDRAEGVRQVLSPVINVVRDARWGRVEESYGEDPLVTSKIAVAFTSALEAAGVVTTPKHYVANVWDGGRDSHSVEISERSLREIYLAPFKAVFQQGGSRSVMCSYNAVNGVPVADSKWLLTDILRNEWGFKGYVVSDWGAAENVFYDFHQSAAPAESVALELNAGLDADHPNIGIFGKPLDEAVAKHLVSMKTIDTAVSRILRVKFELGLFDDPFVDPAKAAALANAPSHRALALRAAQKAMTLLKNDNNVLPLSKAAKRIVVLGDVANGPTPLGGYSGNPGPRSSFLEGLKAEAPDVQFDFVPGVRGGPGSNLPAIPGTAFSGPDGQPGLKAEYWNNETLSGPPVITRTESNIDYSWDGDSPDPAVHATHFSARWTGFLTAPATGAVKIAVTGDDGMRLKLNGVVVAADWSEHAPVTKVAVLRLTKGQRVPFELDFYQVEGGAVARVGWSAAAAPSSLMGRITDRARGADATVVFASIAEGEGADRAYLNLPGNQEDAILAAADGGAPVVVVLVAGSPVTMEKWADRVPAVLDAWYPGEEGAKATAQTLFGDNDPGGRLPITFPLTVGQCPIYYNLEPSGRGYDYVNSTGKPLFAFGHGLSYTKFDYSNLKVEPLRTRNTFQVSVDVRNSGERDGDEVVQLYTHQRYSSVIRPLEELKDFKRIRLAVGATKTVTFTLGFDQLAFLNQANKLVTEAAPVDVMVGAASDDIRVRGELRTVAASGR
ncbi:MAG: glycoside hydrolase family 3 N-terminal domain-containing protein [Fimbriimonadaceae bacterium]